MDERLHFWKSTSWVVQPALNAPELDPEAVQYTILDSDPIESYRKLLTQNREAFRRDIEEEKDPARRNLIKQSQMTSMWDLLFRAVTGDRVGLLVPFRSTKRDSVTRAFAMSSNSPAGRKWLTTKIAFRADIPTCWCIPIATAIDAPVQVELRHENVLDLARLYEEILGSN